ncbi:MAG: roadblock/LC7 domain-containing protein [Syntrophaceae bacterium]|nr:roadblock/LC7 domain-containing protein [Syntrophaceae bacterium]
MRSRCVLPFTREITVSLILGRQHLDRIQDTLKKNLIGSGVQNTMLIDMAGNVIVTVDNGGETRDMYSLAALAAANFGAMCSMAKIVGEDEFSLLFHKGQKENIYFSRVNDELLLINIFNNQVTLGFLRLKMAQVIEELCKVLD